MAKILVFYFKLYFFLILLFSCGAEETGTIVDTGIAKTNSYSVIASGYLHSCGIDNFTSSGQLKCWGSNQYGQLGLGNLIDVMQPTLVDGSTSYKQVVVGAEHTCALTTSNIIKCWGRNNFGQLGTSDNTDALIPVSIDTGTSYSMIAAAGKGTCGITQAGNLKCWGQNLFGSIGDNTALNRNAPVLVDGSTIYKFISVGELHKCGITASDDLKCWGHNGNTELGDGTSLNRFTPVLIDASTRYKKVATSKISSFHTCGITSTDKIKCWGQNTYGQLGDGTTTSRTTPTAINIATSYSDISLGYVHTCAIEAVSGKLFCWGKNEYGQLGDYTTLQQLTSVQADTPKKYSIISAGYNYTIGITSDGFLRGYGVNTNGQVGNNTLIDVLTPQIIK